MKLYRDFIKAIADLLIAAVGFILLSPVFFALCIILAIVNKGSPFFLQSRPGKSDKIFKIIKFKTMNDKRDAHGDLLPDDKRLTAVGKFVRRTSLDEIPQLINVILGQMSLVGPRPLLPEYVDLYTPHQRRRHEVRPGITGWAQVNGRNAISWEQKFDLDVWYVDNQSFKLDFIILLRTIKKVFKREGINMAGQATTTRFTGTQRNKT